jgi:hypothetical protein
MRNVCPWLLRAEPAHVRSASHAGRLILSRAKSAIRFRDVERPCLHRVISRGEVRDGGGGIGEHEASAVTGGGGIEEQPCAVLSGGVIPDPERAGRRRALADAALLAPDSLSL